MVLLAALPASATAGGLSRPNGMSARGTGMGGTFTAWADDASAVFFNPAAMDDAESQVDIGGELVVGPRSYTPVAEDGTPSATTSNCSVTSCSGVPAVAVTYQRISWRPMLSVVGAVQRAT